MTRIVAITGKRGHGKTTAAQALEQQGWRHINYGDPLRKVVHLVYGLSYEEMLDPILKEKELRRWPYLSPRAILQQVGTEMFRDYLDDTWVKAFERECEQYSHVVCSDLRFLNEAASLRAMKATIIRVENPRKPMRDAASLHRSEREMDEIVVDWTVVNDQTVKRLQDAIVDIVL